MKKKIIIIDLIGTVGHINWLKKLFFIIENDLDIIFISYESHCKKTSLKSIIPISDKYLVSRNKYVTVLNQFRALRETKKIVKQFNIDIPIYIVGFENISYSIFGFKKRKVFLHMHNNLDRSRISLFFLKLISSNTSFIVYEKYIQSYLKKYKNLTYVLNHTLNFEAEDRNLSFDNYIFISSKIDDLSLIKPLIQFAEVNNLKILLRSQKPINNKVIISKPFFDNYVDLLMNAKYIVIFSPYNFRVSGVFYEAMLYNKNIISIGSQGVFINTMKKDYPSSFIELEDNNIEIDISKKNNDYSIFLNKHKDLIIKDQLLKIMSLDN
jgi:hypothetical protein